MTEDAGMALRREVLGDDHVDRAVAGTSEFTALGAAEARPAAEPAG